jgi:hypothetical protein
MYKVCRIVQVGSIKTYINNQLAKAYLFTAH